MLLQAVCINYAKLPHRVCVHIIKPLVHSDQHALEFSKIWESAYTSKLRIPAGFWETCGHFEGFRRKLKLSVSLLSHRRENVQTLRILASQVVFFPHLFVYFYLNNQICSMKKTKQSMINNKLDLHSGKNDEMQKPCIWKDEAVFCIEVISENGILWRISEEVSLLHYLPLPCVSHLITVGVGLSSHPQ